MCYYNDHFHRQIDSMNLSLSLSHNGIASKHYTTSTALSDTYISSFRTMFFWVVTIAQLVEVTDSTVLGGVGEVVRWSTSSHNIFQYLPAAKLIYYLIYFIECVKKYV